MRTANRLSHGPLIWNIAGANNLRSNQIAFWTADLESFSNEIKAAEHSDEIQ